MFEALMHFLIQLACESIRYFQLVPRAEKVTKAYFSDPQGK